MVVMEFRWESMSSWWRISVIHSTDAARVLEQGRPNAPRVYSVPNFLPSPYTRTQHTTGDRWSAVLFEVGSERRNEARAIECAVEFDSSQ